MPKGGARGQNLGHLRFFFFAFIFLLYGIIQFEQHVLFRVFLSDRKVQCPRVGLEVKIYETPAGGISQGTSSS